VHLLVICALVIGLLIMLLIGLLAMVNELYSQKIFGMPFDVDGNSTRDYADEEQSASSPQH
jgi:hypothetical protein